jgi:tRNA threonylcarbamoyladenosine biosynthesis protein TsaB
MNGPLLLALDTGSPLVSVALAGASGETAVRAVAIERSSARLLELIGELLAQAGARPADLSGVAALRGPGSFTGVRVGLATALALHQALGVRATALPSLHALAEHAAVEGGAGQGAEVVAAVDALRGDWSAAVFRIGRTGPETLSDAGLVSAIGLPGLFSSGASSRVLAGFGVARLAALPGWPAEIRLLEPGPLAAAAARLAARPDAVWDAGLLTAPLYSRPPAITLPRPRIPAAAPSPGRSRSS